MKQLLQSSVEKLKSPANEARKKLLIVLNIVYILTTIFFLTSEKVVNGMSGPTIELVYFVYLPVLIVNALSLVYNTISFIGIYSGRDYYHFTAWSSMCSIMFMSFCQMNGIGNPFNDALFTDFALAHSLIIISGMVVNRALATFWFITVVLVLIFNVHNLGWDYSYHFLTPEEAKQYELALQNQKDWAIERENTLSENGLNPPKASRFFNTWLVFIIAAFYTAFYFSNIRTDILKKIPEIINNIKKASKEMILQEEELKIRNIELNKSRLKILQNDEILEKVHLELERLDFEKKEEFNSIIEAIKKILSNESQWEAFMMTFDLTHNGFFDKVRKTHGELTENELRHLALIKMNMASKEISKMMKVKTSSLRSMRYRLKKKIGLDDDVDLFTHLASLEA